MANLLKNPDFEGGAWRQTHTGQQLGEISVPQDWVCFWREGGKVPHDLDNKDGYKRPECKVIAKQPPFLKPLRIQSGNQAWLCFTFFGIHDAGLYQRVEGLTPGMRLRASAWAHAWSSQGDNASKSDTQGGGKYNFTFRVGIDPKGGTDPWSEDIVWSDAKNYYDAYQQTPPVEAVAQGSAVTVFLRSTVMWRFKHCDSYWDNAELTIVGEGELPGLTPGPTPGPTPTPTPVVEPQVPTAAKKITVTIKPKATDKPDVLQNVIDNVALDPGSYTMKVLIDDVEAGKADFEVK
ncbi:MAG: hypothetical protein RBT47_10330 [Anaerolineae bacterium]|nr:hypothetical protein [Anaerolineae bacterium]